MPNLKTYQHTILTFFVLGLIVILGMRYQSRYQIHVHFSINQPARQ